MKLIGFERADFVAKDSDKQITGYRIYLARPADPSRGKGQIVDCLYISDMKIEANHFDIANAINKDVEVYYNRYGKVARIALAD